MLDPQTRWTHRYLVAGNVARWIGTSNDHDVLTRPASTDSQNANDSELSDDEIGKRMNRAAIKIADQVDVERFLDSCRKDTHE